MENACDRIMNISKSLRLFSRVDQESKVAIDVHDGLESTLLILKHRLKANDDRPKIEIVKHYDDLPDISCFPSRLNQVFMNLLDNAIDALAIYAQNQNAIDVVLTDIMMPSMNGKTLIRTIKKINPQIDIIVFSGLISNREIITELDGSIAAFINKPYTTEALLKTIHQAIGDRTKSS